MFKVPPVKTPAKSSQNRNAAVVALLLAAAVIGIYLPVGRHSFLTYDDGLYVTDNWYVQQGLTWETVKWAFTNTSQSNNWHPLTWLSHMTDVELFGKSAVGPHYVNLAFHAANTLILFGLLFYTTRRTWPAVAAAAIFALHPLRVESVAWIAERKDVLSGFFWFSTMFAWAWYSRKPGFIRYACVLLAFTLGLMAKPMLVTMPVVLLLLDYWPLQRFEPGKNLLQKRLRFSGPDITLWAILLEKVPLLLLSAASSVITFIAQGHAVAALEVLDVWTRVTNAVVSYGRYIWMSLWPAGLAVFYPHPHSPLYGAAAVVCLALVAITVAVVLAGRRRKFLITGWFWYLITLLPVIGLVQVGDQSHADRYTYIPMIGIAIAIIWLIAEAVQHRPLLSKFIAILTFLVLAAMSVVTYMALGYWTDSETLFRRAIAVTRDNYAMKANLAIVLATKEKLDESRQYAQESFELRQTDAVMALLGGLAARQGHYEDALEWFNKALPTGGNTKELQFNVGSVLLTLGRPSEALPYLRRATELDPRWSEAFALLGAALVQTGNAKEAAAALRQSISLEEGLVKTYFGTKAAASHNEQRERSVDAVYAELSNTAGRLAGEGRLADSEKYCRAAIELKPDWTYAYYNLAIVLSAQERKDEALEVLRTIDRIKPGDPETQRQIKRLTEPQQ